MHSYEHKLGRAKEHLVTLNRETSAYVGSDFYEVAREYDADGLGYVDVVKRVAPVPAHISVVFGDAVQNLRNCLDHIVWQIRPPKVKTPMRMLTGNPRFGIAPERLEAKPQFPILIDPTSFTEAKKRAMGLLPADAQAIIQRLQPYHGWDPLRARRPQTDGVLQREIWAHMHPLWTLHQLSNIDKHRALHIVATTGQLIYASGGDPNCSMSFSTGGPLKLGTELVKVRCAAAEATRDVQMDYEFAFGIALEEDRLGSRFDLFPAPLTEIMEFIESAVIPPLVRFL